MPGRFPESVPVRVRVGDCTCPDAPHTDGDFVTLEPKLTPAAGMAAIRALTKSGTDDANVVIMAAILPHVIRGWDFLDYESKQPLEITPASVREALPWTAGGFEVANRAVDLYLGEVMGPLASRLSPKRKRPSSPSTPTELTSATPSSSRKRQKPSA